jgi:hypothetical protein
MSIGLSVHPEPVKVELIGVGGMKLKSIPEPVISESTPVEVDCQGIEMVVVPAVGGWRGDVKPPL